MEPDDRQRWQIVKPGSLEPFTYPDGRPGLTVHLKLRCPNPDCESVGIYAVSGHPESEPDMTMPPCPGCGGVFWRPRNPFTPDL